MNRLLCLSVLLVSTAMGKVFVNIEETNLQKLEKAGFKFERSSRTQNNISVLEVSEDKLSHLSGLLHQVRKMCGGLSTFLTQDLAEEDINKMAEMRSLNSLRLESYELKFQHLLPEMVQQVDAKNIEANIRHLSSYHNRYYKSDTGVESMAWIKSTWEGLTKNRSDIKVEEFEHSWKQPSIILTIEGSGKKDEVIILGGHGDSISGFLFASKNRAPGADDNASGISTLTEILRVLLANNFKPERTVKFMAYAAEEVGLRGSKDIAKKFEKDEINVKGVLQLDMTNFNGSEKKIYLMDDFTNKAQNEFLGSLIDEYVKVSWGYSRCGYACSDHASWHSQGFPASMPSESTFDDSNPAIHTSKDEIEESGGSADHAALFAKLGIAYAMEVSF